MTDDLSKMFSGLRSQWMIFASFRTLKASRSCAVNTRTSDVDNPRNEFCLMSSYRLFERSSKTRHRCEWWMKVSLSRSMWCSSSLSHWLLICARASSAPLRAQSLTAKHPYQLEDRDLHHRLLEVRRLVLNDLDRDHLVRPHVLTLDDLAKRALPEHVEDQVPVTVEATRD